MLKINPSFHILPTSFWYSVTWDRDYIWTMFYRHHQIYSQWNCLTF